MLSGREAYLLQNNYSRKSKFVILPLVTYAPETRWGFGGTAQLFFRFKNDSLLHPSIGGITTLYTLNRQFIVSPQWDVFFYKNKGRISGAFLYQRYPDWFYGIGNQTSERARERFTADYIMFKIRNTWKIYHRLYLGPQIRYEQLYRMHTEPGGLFATEQVTGRKGYVASGLGVALIADSRDNILFPFSGYYIVFSHHTYPSRMGTTFPLTSITIDSRYYWNIISSHVLVFNAYAQFHSGQHIPFKMMAMLGGPQLMRGYFQGRYRDRNAIVLQMEYRFPIWWRFIGVFFASAGDVFNQSSSLMLQTLKIAGGAGLRFTVDAQERINIRFDAAWGRFRSQGFYLSLTEAF